MATQPSKLYSQASLLSLKQWKLRNWAFFTGLTAEGTKAALAERIHHRMKNVSPCRKQTLRVVSVDMGIRNLAFCAIDIPSPHIQFPDRKPPIDVKSWVRLDLLNNQPQRDLDAERKDEEPQEPAKSSPSKRKTKARRDNPILQGTFEPATWARTAYGVVLTLLQHKPDVILIERQRYRSGGVSAVLEWTLRVNMLESMLWACLETIRAENKVDHSNLQTIVSMSPSHVAKFWVGPRDGSQSVPDDFFADDACDPRLTSVRASDDIKKEKISIIRSWVSGKSDMLFNFEDDTAQIAEAFRSTQKRAASKLAGGKLDDLADCMLQAMTWVQWQQNQHRIGELYTRMLDEKASSHRPTP